MGHVRPPPGIVVLEAPWVPRFSTHGGLLPESSALPFISALASYFPARILYRQLLSPADLTRWCKALRHARLGASTKTVWVAAHGVGAVAGGRKVAAIKLPGNGRVTPSDLRRSLSKCGTVGVVLDSCAGGTTPPGSWLPPNALFGLAFAAPSVPWIDSLLFGVTALTWLLDDTEGPPRDGRTAHVRYRSGVTTGRHRDSHSRTDYTAVATSLGARFHWQERGEWKTCAAPEFA